MSVNKSERHQICPYVSVFAPVSIPHCASELFLHSHCLKKHCLHCSNFFIYDTNYCKLDLNSRRKCIWKEDAVADQKNTIAIEKMQTRFHYFILLFYNKTQKCKHFVNTSFLWRHLVRLQCCLQAKMWIFYKVFYLCTESEVQSCFSSLIIMKGNYSH